MYTHILYFCSHCGAERVIPWVICRVPVLVPSLVFDIFAPEAATSLVDIMNAWTYLCIKRLLLFVAAASPAHLPAPPVTAGDVIMLTNESAAAAAALVPDQAAAVVDAPAPEGISPLLDQAAAPDQAALPDPFSETHQARVPHRPSERRSLPTAVVEEIWAGVDPNARLEPLSAAESADQGVACAMC